MLVEETGGGEYGVDITNRKQAELWKMEKRGHRPVFRRTTKAEIKGMRDAADADAHFDSVYSNCAS